LKRLFWNRKNIKIRPPPFLYPRNKAENYKWIQTSLRNGTLPKIFRPTMFWQGHNLTDMVVIADYDLIKEAFRE